MKIIRTRLLYSLSSYPNLWIFLIYLCVSAVRERTCSSRKVSATCNHDSFGLVTLLKGCEGQTVAADPPNSGLQSGNFDSNRELHAKMRKEKICEAKPEIFLDFLAYLIRDIGLWCCKKQKDIKDASLISSVFKTCMFFI